MNDKKQLSFFPQEENDWEAEWVGMPEYNNVYVGDPVITVTFKFKTEGDFDKFASIVRDALFNGEKPFDGMQRKERKTAWWPPREKASNYQYEDEDES